MDERLFTRLSALLQQNVPVVLASVLATRGATPRKRGSRMLITMADTEFSVGGGMAEAQVIAAARALLQRDGRDDAVGVDLSGRPDAAGVCGGSMQVVLRRWKGPQDCERALALARRLSAGEVVRLGPGELGAHAGMAPVDGHGRNVGEDAADVALLQPNVRLLIVGGGHCGLALYELARSLEFDQWVFDARPECFAGSRFCDATRLCGAPALLGSALETQRTVYAVLLNRDFSSDVAALDVLCTRPPRFLGMMGSRKRIAEVRAALPGHVSVLKSLHAPVGIDLGEETPHEIAVSILAQLIRERSASRGEPLATGH